MVDLYHGGICLDNNIFEFLKCPNLCFVAIFLSHFSVLTYVSFIRCSIFISCLWKNGRSEMLKVLQISHFVCQSMLLYLCNLTIPISSDLTESLDCLNSILEHSVRKMLNISEWSELPNPCVKA